MVNYPTSLDTFPNPTSATLENAAGFEHDVGHSNLGDAIEAIEGELGTDPSGSFATVKARLAGLTPTIATTAPSSPVTGQVWYDSTTTPYVGKVWNGSAWTIFSQAGSGSGVPWAQVTGGTVTEYTKGDGSVMEVHTFTAAGSLTVVAAGYADVLLVSGGGGAASETGLGAGGRILSGLRPLPSGVQTVTVGQPGNGAGTPSVLGPLTTYYSPNYYGGAGATVAAGTSGFPSSITGTADDYGRSGVAIRANHGDGGAGNAQGSSGIVIVAVQKTPPTASGVVASGGTESTFTGDGTNGVLGQTYKVHTFTASGSLVVSAAGAVDVLLVGGGGGGGGLGSASGIAAGGGGGGGVAEITGHPLPVGTHVVTVGAGGGGGVAATAAGVSGQVSSVHSLAGWGGGFGGGGYADPGGSGGSGGGARAVGAGGSGVTGQGFAGGAGGSVAGGAGGGGASAVGVTGSSSVGGAGGAGRSSLINGTATTYGGGGGGGVKAGSAGGAGGAGGGGAGNHAGSGVAGTANRGGGGGGGGSTSSDQNGGAGGSGIVIIRYKV